MLGGAAPDFDRVIAEPDALQLRLTQRIDELARERENLIVYGRSKGLDEASSLCSRMTLDTYYPDGSRFKHFIPKALEQQSNSAWTYDSRNDRTVHPKPDRQKISPT